MNKITINLPDWLLKRITDLKIGNTSSAIRTLLIFSVRDFEKFIKEIGLDPEDEEEPELRALKMLGLFINRLAEGGRLQNNLVPGFPADFEPALNRLREGGGGEEPLFNRPTKTPLGRDPTWDICGTGRIP